MFLIDGTASRLLPPGFPGVLGGMGEKDVVPGPDRTYVKCAPFGSMFRLAYTGGTTGKPKAVVLTSRYSNLLDDLIAPPPRTSGPPSPVHGDPKHGNCLWQRERRSHCSTGRWPTSASR